MQKAAVAGAPVLVGVGAPTSLAVALAREQGITLCGFARGGEVNVYSGPERVDAAGRAGRRPERIALVMRCGRRSSSAVGENRPMSEAEGTVAVVTGGARGFGLEIARRLVARGHAVLITDLDEAVVADAAAGLGARAGRPRRRRGGRRRAGADGAGRRGAGAARGLGQQRGRGAHREDGEHSDAEVEQTVKVNLLGVIHGTRAAIDAMRATGGGHILNIASMSSFGRCPGSASTRRRRRRS